MQNLLRTFPFNLSSLKELIPFEFWKLSTSKKLNLIDEPEKVDSKLEKRNYKRNTLL